MPYTIKLNKKELERVDEALAKSVLSYAKEVGKILKEKKVIPKNSGDLEKSQKIRRAPYDRHIALIHYNVDYATRVYYGNLDESASSPVTFKYRRKPRNEKDTNPVNPHARARWIEEVLYDRTNAERFAKYVRKNLGELSYSELDISDEYDWEAENEEYRMLARAERYDDSAEENMKPGEFFGDEDMDIYNGSDGDDGDYDY